MILVKRLTRIPETEEFEEYREKNPNATWEQMKNDGFNNGPQIFQNTRRALFTSQGSLCAYCELSVDFTNDPRGSRVEHFHSKSDAGEINWHLVWGNLMGACSGNTVKDLEEPAFRSPPKKHLSCDAHKDQLIQTRKLDEACEGFILNPYDLPAFPNLFRVKPSSGELLPNAPACAASPRICEEQFGTNAKLVENTIKVFNLNCGRLCDGRKAVVRRLNIQLEEARLSGETKNHAERRLADRHLSDRWPQFFSTYRVVLANGFEEALKDMGYNG